MLWPSLDSSCNRLAIRSLPFHLLDLLKPADVALASVEPRRDERAHELGRELRADHFRAEAQNIHVVVLYALVRRIDVVTDGSPDSGDFRRCDRSADARPAYEHGPLGVAAPDRLADLARLVGIVDPRLRAVGAEIDALVAQCCELREDAFPQLHSAVVEGDRDLHQDRYVTRDERGRAVAGAGTTATSGLDPLRCRHEIGPPDLVYVRGRPDGRAAGQVPPLRLRRP